ncbi:MAG TPA: cytochrome c biogenesis protein CcdA [Saprospiraceae bacterium]|nr:cytochrome c biogenesis protein CcdA [Saprospiraceae bacterium]
MIRIFGLLLILIFSYQIFGQAPAKAPIKWTYKKEQISGNEFDLIFTAIIDKGWNTYSMYTEDNGPVPTAIEYEEKKGITLKGKAVEYGEKKAGMDDLFGVNVIKFYASKPYTIKQRIVVNDPKQPLKGYLTYMVCDDAQCLPPTDVDFSFDFKDVSLAPKEEEKKNETTVIPENETDEKSLTVEESSITLIAENNAVNTTGGENLKYNIENGIIDQRIPSMYETHDEPLVDCGTQRDENKGWFWTFLFGFGGGLLALLTPCVFPMLPITVSFFTKDTKRKGWMNGLIYGLSIIAIYVGLGLLITAVFGAEALNRLSTNWIANTLFFLIFIAFAFSFFGFYEITLPSSWTTSTDKMADKGGLIGIFFMAFTLALVSFSCTGPIVGTALVQAATKGEYIGPFLVMFGFSLALALPFGLFAAFPAWLNSLPKSGSWMNSVKVVLGFLELALALKFLSVADMTNHWGFLKYELFMGLWILIFSGMALYLFGFIKFPHDSPLKKLSITRIGFASVNVLLILYLISGLFTNKTTNSYNALSLMSGLAPPTNYNFFLKPEPLDESISAKYPSYSKCANNINCFKNYYDGMNYAKETGKPVLLDFTGYGCVNCRKTEEHIWSDDQIRDILSNKVVLISLYGDDDKATEENLQQIRSKYTNQRIRNIGKLWADFQMANFETNAQPLYVFVTQDERVVAPPRGYEEGVKSYLDFLNCGLAVNKK